MDKINNNETFKTQNKSNKELAIEIIDNLEFKDFDYIYNDDAKKKSAFDISNKNDDKKTAIVNVIKNKLIGSHFETIKALITNSWISFENNNDIELKIKINLTSIGRKNSTKDIVITGFNKSDKKNKWYMITTISGKEDKVVESLINRAISEGVDSYFDLLIDEKKERTNIIQEDLKNHLFKGFRVFYVNHISPKELEKRNSGKDYIVRLKNLYKGYVFVKMKMTNLTWFIVRNTQYVTGLVGSSGQRAKPTPVSEKEIQNMEQKSNAINKEFIAGKIKSPFVPGVIVKIIDGPTKGQIGTILENNDERSIAVVEIILFERKTPTEIPYANLSLKK